MPSVPSARRLLLLVLLASLGCSPFVRAQLTPMLLMFLFLILSGFLGPVFGGT
jgi:hypothetical protein